jgi:hypothetical protein
LRGFKNEGGFQKGLRVSEESGGGGVSENDKGHLRMRKGFKRRIWGFEETRGFHRRTEGLRRREGSSFREVEVVLEKDRGVSRRLEGSRKNWWFPRRQRGFREVQRPSKNKKGIPEKDMGFRGGESFTEGRRVFKKERGFQKGLVQFPRSRGDFTEG